MTQQRWFPIVPLSHCPPLSQRLAACYRPSRTSFPLLLQISEAWAAETARVAYAAQVAGHCELGPGLRPPGAEAGELCIRPCLLILLAYRNSIYMRGEGFMMGWNWGGSIAGWVACATLVLVVEIGVLASPAPSRAHFQAFRMRVRKGSG